MVIPWGVREGLVIAAVSLVVAGCFTQPPSADGAGRSVSTPPGKTKRSTTCGALPAKRCYQRADCADGFDCVDHAPGAPAPPHVRVTGMGASFGTDDQPCDRRPPVCQTGEVPVPITRSNLCPDSECRAPCTATSCGAGEECLREGYCRAIACNAGWTCTAGAYCGFGNRGTDLHGCTPACPTVGYCVPRGDPIP